MNRLSGDRINPLIGSAGVSAVPMAARVSQKVGQEDDPNNFLLMHAMGPNVAGVIGTRGRGWRPSQHPAVTSTPAPHPHDRTAVRVFSCYFGRIYYTIKVNGAMAPKSVLIGGI